MACVEDEEEAVAYRAGYPIAAHMTNVPLRLAIFIDYQ
jgi:hypothetical protein